MKMNSVTMKIQGLRSTVECALSQEEPVTELTLLQWDRILSVSWTTGVICGSEDRFQSKPKLCCLGECQVMAPY